MDCPRRRRVLLLRWHSRIIASRFAARVARRVRRHRPRCRALGPGDWGRRLGERRARVLHRPHRQRACRRRQPNHRGSPRDVRQP